MHAPADDLRIVPDKQDAQENEQNLEEEIGYVLRNHVAWSPQEAWRSGLTTSADFLLDIPEGLGSERSYHTTITAALRRKHSP
jgi:hypothetical protein